MRPMSAPAALQRQIDATLAFLWRESPVAATLLGIHDHDDRLADYDAEAIAGRGRSLARLRDELRAVAAGAGDLGADDRLDLRLLDQELEVEERQIVGRRSEFRDPASYLDEFLHGVYVLLQREFAPPPDRAASAARRLQAVPRLLDQARRNLGDGREVPPEWLKGAVQQIGGVRAFLAGLRVGLLPAAGSAAADLERGIAVAAAAADDFEALLRGPIAATASGRFAAGRGMFEFLLRVQHGIPEDADALRRFGEDLIARTQDRLAEAVARLAPGRTWHACLDEWKSDHPAAAGFVEVHRREVERARAFVIERGLLTLPPGERIDVVETPEFQRPFCPFAAYLPPGPFEARQQGVFWVTPPADGAGPEKSAHVLRDHLRAAIPGTVAHEAYPGHHVQLSLVGGIASKVRRSFSTPVFVEGWGFYCEELMADEGFGDDPRCAVLQLKDQLWRACRVVIDVGLHTGDMTCDEAVRLLCDVARIEEPNARGEVLRYTRSPTQPLSYAVGKRAILALRDECRRAWGPRFSLRAFHDRLLSFGSPPLSLIRDPLLAAVP
jgi:uncharacterized protein (DUF885 family)